MKWYLEIPVPSGIFVWGRIFSPPQLIPNITPLPLMIGVAQME